MSTKKPKANKPSTDPAVDEKLELRSSEASDSHLAAEEQDTSSKKAAKVKLIRDSFTFPEQDYQKISAIKKTCLAEGMHVKKSEVLRAGLQLLSNLSLSDLKQVFDQVERLPTGRPKAS